MIRKNSSWGNFPEGVNLITVCPSCNTKYNPVQAKVLEENGNAHLLFISCKNCGSGVVALITSGGMGVTSMGLITDLSAEDILKFKESEFVSSSDVLKMHKLLESKNNDYLKLFIE